MAGRIFSMLREQIGDGEDEMIFDILLQDDTFGEYVSLEENDGKTKTEIIEEIIRVNPRDLLLSLAEGGFESLIQVISLDEYLAHSGKVSPEGQIVDMALDATRDGDYKMLTILVENRIPIDSQWDLPLSHMTISLLNDNGYTFSNHRRVKGPSGVKEFKYINGLGRPFRKEKNIKSVTFPISRYGEHEHTLFFKPSVNEEEAIIQAEEWMNQPFNEDYFDSVNDDIFQNDLTFEEAKKNYPTRGSLLTDLHLLESANREKDGNLVLSFSTTF